MRAQKAILIAAALIGLALAASSPARAQDKTEIINQRQQLMKTQGREWGAIKGYLDGKASQEDAAKAADALTKSVPTVINYFPAGTGIGEAPVKTRAKPEIWSEHDKFLAADKQVLAQVQALDAALKSGDKEKASAAFKELDGCNGCHRTFRGPQEKP